MKFKHTFHVFVDNFAVIYKQLLYRLVISVIAGVLYAVCIYSFLNELTGSSPFIRLIEGVKRYFDDFIAGEFADLPSIAEGVKTAFEEFIALFRGELGSLILTLFLMMLVKIVEKWFTGIGNYATAAVINDKMALRANSPFLSTLIRNCKKAALYNAIYAPLSVLYDVAVAVAMFFILYALVIHGFPFLVAIFLFALILVVAISFKMTFTTDWVPALIRGRMGQGEAFVYTFSRKNKSTLNVLSNFVVLVLIIFSVNVLAVISTFGVAALLTIPASYVIILCFEMVNYFDREQIKYSVDDRTIISPAQEHVPTREEFFRGEDD